MIDHIIFEVTNFARSTAFYDRALGPLDLKRVYGNDDESAGTAAFRIHALHV